MLLTAIIGMLLATPGWVPWQIMVFGTIGIGFTASAGATINHLIDRHIDALMHRTQRRPLPSGKLNITNAIYFAILLAVI